MKKKMGLFILSLLLPTLVMAESAADGIPIIAAIFVEAFVSIHMSIFVLTPLARLISKDDDYKKTFWKLFVIRAAILLFFDFFVTTSIVAFDFIFVFIGAFIIVPICSIIFKKNLFETRVDLNAINNKLPVVNSNPTPANNVILKCKSCGGVLKVTDNFCTNCGAPFQGDNVTVEEAPVSEPVENIIHADPMFALSETAMIEEFLSRTMSSCNLDKNSKLIPREALKKKKIMAIIFVVLFFIYIAMIFFHFTLKVYVIGLIILIIFFVKTRKFNIMAYLKKKIKERPSEKVANIVMEAKESMVEDDTKKGILISLVCCVLLAMMVFKDPHIIYEKMDDGYGVRFYTWGVTNFKTAEIPDSYKDEDIISIRGNVFANMYLLKEVKIPDTVTEIRGKAFKNDFFLEKVTIPSNLKYLGGGAFYNCHSIKKIELPDTVTFMGGETFYHAYALEEIKLSKNIEEIRGNSFEECSSLKEVEIPDKVKRIGGHAFYGNSSLEKVTISENSQLVEIGSSAFRLCPKLRTIELPESTYINERAFKESPTVVYRFGEVRYGEIIDDSLYDSTGFLYIKTGELSYITQIKNRKEYNSYIFLKSIVKRNNSSVFFLQYVDAEGKMMDFELSLDNSYIILNDNLAVEVSAKYVFNRTDSVSLNVYYN